MAKATAVIVVGLFALGMAAAPAVRAQDDDKAFKAHILIMEKPEELRKWMNRKPADRGGDSGRLRSVHAGKKIFFPVIATGVQAPGAGQATEIFADVEFFAPNGKSVARMKKCCSATIRGATGHTAFSLGPVVDLEIEPGDVTGTYTVKARVTDGTRYADATETFQYDGPGAPPAAAAKPEKKAAEPKPAAAAAPAREMAPQAPKTPPGKSRDVSHCLGLPTPAEVIKCTEKAR